MRTTGVLPEALAASICLCSRSEIDAMLYLSSVDDRCPLSLTQYLSIECPFPCGRGVGTQPWHDCLRVNPAAPAHRAIQQRSRPAIAAGAEDDSHESALARAELAL